MNNPIQPDIIFPPTPQEPDDFIFEPEEEEISVEDMQKIVDANEKLVKELEDGTNTISE